MIKLNYEYMKTYFYPDIKGWTSGCFSVICCILGIFPFGLGIITMLMFFSPELQLKSINDIITPLYFTILGIVFLFLAHSLIKNKKTPAKIYGIYKEIDYVKDQIIEKAALRLGVELDECNEQKPIILGYHNFDVKRFNKFAINVADKFPSNYRFIVLLFSKTQLFYYDYTFSLISNESYEKTGEYFYSDIVSFDTKEKHKKLTFGNDCYTFSAATSGGTIFSIDIAKSDEEKIKMIRQIIREKKHS